MLVLRMTAPTFAPIGPRAMPAGFTTSSWGDHHAPDIHRLLVDSYRGGGGEVEAYEIWYRYVTTDSEFDPSLCFLAFREAELCGVVLCWTSAFVKDLCVASPYRRRGLGEALIGLAMAACAQRGAATISLKVDAANEAALSLYRRCGFQPSNQAAAAKK
jgi:ribosomal protein S18 acetylase RimI-like enzyme